jgi:hypothetical protein
VCLPTLSLVVGHGDRRSDLTGRTEAGPECACTEGATKGPPAGLVRGRAGWRPGPRSDVRRGDRWVEPPKAHRRPACLGGVTGAPSVAALRAHAGRDPSTRRGLYDATPRTQPLRSTTVVRWGAPPTGPQRSARPAPVPRSGGAVPGLRCVRCRKTAHK